MSYIEKNLSGDEKLIKLFKQHWFSLVVPVILIPWIIGILLIFIRNSKEMGLTSKRVIKKTGLIGRKTNELILKKVETVEVNVGILGRIFGYGDVKITGTGISDLVFDKVGNPEEVKNQIDSVVNEMN